MDSIASSYKDLWYFHKGGKSEVLCTIYSKVLRLLPQAKKVYILNKMFFFIRSILRVQTSNILKKIRFSRKITQLVKTTVFGQRFHYFTTVTHISKNYDVSNSNNQT